MESLGLQLMVLAALMLGWWGGRTEGRMTGYRRGFRDGFNTAKFKYHP